MKMKRFAILFLLLSTVLCFTGCGFNSLIDDSKDPYINEENNGISIIEIKIDDSSVRSSRSAVPVIGPAETISYSVVAKKGSETIGPVTETVAGLDVYQLQVTPGEWVVSVTGTGPTGKDILYGTRTVQVSDSGKYGATVSMQYIMGEGVTGSIALTWFINTTKYGVDSMVISGTGTSLDSSYTPVSGKIDINKINFPTGDYFPVFKFYKGTNLVCVISERISVRKNRTTSTWIKNGSEVWLTENASGNIEFKITDDVIDSLINHTLFVKGTGGTLTGTASDSNTGTWAAPLSTVQKAIDKIMLMNDITSKYTIYVDGEVIDALININGSDLKLDIQGFNGDPAKDILNANKNSGNKAVSISLTANNPDQMYINFSNIKITGGYTSTYNIYVLKPSVVFTNCVIEGNYVNDTNPNGLIYSIAGSITFNNTQVKNNYIKKEVCGAVYALMGATIELTGENYIYDNYAIEANETLTGTQENVIVSSSTAIKILGDITGSKIGVSTTETIQINNPLKFTDNFKASGTTADPSQIFVSDNKYTVGYDPTYSEAVLAVSSYAPIIQMHEDLEIRCLKSKIINPTGCGKSGRTVEFRLYSKTTGEDLTDTASWSVKPKYIGSVLPKAYWSVNVNGNKCTFAENIPYEIFNITAIAAAHGTTVSTTHNVQVVELSRASTLGATIPADTSVIALADINDLNQVKEWMENGASAQSYELILQNDFTIQDFETIDIGDAKAFAGTLDGNGHSITMNTTDGNDSYGGIFGCIGAATVKNLTLKGSLTKNGGVGAVGALADTTGSNAVTIQYCENHVNITNNSTGTNSYTGGFIGSGTANITHCKNYGNVTSANSCAGGLIGEGAGSGIISNCVNEGEIQASTTNTSAVAGGIIANLSMATTYSIYNCVNKGTIKAYSAGGIAYKTSVVINCSNYGSVIGINYVGGILGYAVNPVVKNCLNAGEISNATKQGAVLAYWGGSSTVVNNFYLKKTDSITGINNSADDTSRTCAFTSNGSVSTTVQAIDVSSVKYTDVVYLLNKWIESNTPPTGAPAYSLWTYDSNGLPKLMCEE